MINRILIRIKVVQMLYSYLLLEKTFRLESQPTPPTKEKRFAYALYLDMLVLVVRIAESVEKRGGEKPLYDNRFIRSLVSDDKLRPLILRYGSEPFPYQSAVAPLAEKIKESGVYKNFLKKDRNTLGAEITIWRDFFNVIISRDPQLNALFAEAQNYSLRGVDRMRELMDATFTNFLTSQDNVHDALKELRKSLDKARELYFRLLTLPVELTRMREREIDEAQNKFIRSEEDMNPNMRFVENQLVELIAAEPTVNEYVAEKKLAWFPEDDILLRSLLRKIKQSDVYADYMEFPVTDLHLDCEFWRNTFKYIILNDPDFLEALEDKSVFWNDDLEIIGTFVLKTFKRFDENAQGGDRAVMDMYKDEEDARFGAELFGAVVSNKDQYRQLIDSQVNVSSWDTDRLAFMDVVIMETALAEIMNFPKIPTNVSINEYIEMARAYSTPKSAQFVHGVLGGVVERLQQEGKLLKA